MTVRRPLGAADACLDGAVETSARAAPAALEVVGGVLVVLGMYIAAPIYVIALAVLAMLIPSMAADPALGPTLMREFTGDLWAVPIIFLTPIMAMLIGHVLMSVGRVQREQR